MAEAKAAHLCCQVGNVAVEAGRGGVVGAWGVACQVVAGMAGQRAVSRSAEERGGDSSPVSLLAGHSVCLGRHVSMLSRHGS